MGSGSGSAFQDTTTARLRAMLHDRNVKRDPQKVAAIRAELRARRGKR
jgi:hypothetical protein